MNAILKAQQTMKSIIADATKGNRTTDDIRVDLMKLSKAELVDMLAAKMSEHKISVETVVQRILSHEDCAWLTYADVAAALVAAGVGANTSSKSIASYVSKGKWELPERKSASERSAELMKLAV